MRRRPRSAILAAALAILAATTGACSSGSSGAPSPTVEATPSVLDERTYEGRTFWYGDDLGSLFELELRSARLVGDADEATVELDLAASNLLTEPGTLPLGGRLEGASADLPVEAPDQDDPIDPGDSVARVARAPGAPGDVDLDDLVLVLGDEDENQVRVPLDPAVPLDEEAPVEGEVPTETVAIAPGARMTVTGSVRYPRWGGGRADQQRLQIRVDVTVDELEPGVGNGLLLHPSLTGPDGVAQSVGDQNAFPPGDAFVERAVLLAPIAGEYSFAVLEVETGTVAEIRFAID